MLPPPADCYPIATGLDLARQALRKTSTTLRQPGHDTGHSPGSRRQGCCSEGLLIMTDQMPARRAGVSMPVAYVAVLVAALLAVSVLGAVWMMSHKSPQTEPREVTLYPVRRPLDGQRHLHAHEGHVARDPGRRGVCMWRYGSLVCRYEANKDPSHASSCSISATSPTECVTWRECWTWCQRRHSAVAFAPAHR